jgi:hypothetical protein
MTKRSGCNSNKLKTNSQKLPAIEMNLNNSLRRLPPIASKSPPNSIANPKSLIASAKNWKNSNGIRHQRSTPAKSTPTKRAKS